MVIYLKYCFLFCFIKNIIDRLIRTTYGAAFLLKTDHERYFTMSYAMLKRCAVM